MPTLVKIIILVTFVGIVGVVVAIFMLFGLKPYTVIVSNLCENLGSFSDSSVNTVLNFLGNNLQTAGGIGTGMVDTLTNQTKLTTIFGYHV